MLWKGLKGGEREKEGLTKREKERGRGRLCRGGARKIKGGGGVGTREREIRGYIFCPEGPLNVLHMNESWRI